MAMLCVGLHAPVQRNDAFGAIKIPLSSYCICIYIYIHSRCGDVEAGRSRRSIPTKSILQRFFQHEFVFIAMLEAHDLERVMRK